MSRRVRLLLLGALALVVVVVGGGFAYFALSGDDAPPPPRLEGRPASGAAAEGAQRLRPVASAGTFVGYRVDEEYLGVGVRTAVGRTSAIDGSVTASADRVEPAR